MELNHLDIQLQTWDKVLMVEGTERYILQYYAHQGRAEVAVALLLGGTGPELHVRATVAADMLLSVPTSSVPLANTSTSRHPCVLCVPLANTRTQSTPPMFHHVCHALLAFTAIFKHSQHQSRACKAIYAPRAPSSHSPAPLARYAQHPPRPSSATRRSTVRRTPATQVCALSASSAQPLL